MSDLAEQIAALQKEKEQIIHTADLRAAWYDGRIYELEQQRKKAAPPAPTPDRDPVLEPSPPQT